MIKTKQIKIESTINELFREAKNDYYNVLKGISKSIFRPLEPKDLENAYLAISKEQGEDLVRLINNYDIKNVVEFGTSFGISTIYLAKGVMKTGGHIVTTELIESKATQAKKNFKQAGVDHLIELRTGDALETLKDHDLPIDLLLLDGWKDLYLPLFNMLKSKFHANTIIYVDNADMGEVQSFLKITSKNSEFKFDMLYRGKVCIIRNKLHEEKIMF